MHLIYKPEIAPLGVYSRQMNTDVHIKDCMIVQASFICNSQKQETIKTFYNWWVIK